MERTASGWIGSGGWCCMKAGSPRTVDMYDTNESVDTNFFIFRSIYVRQSRQETVDTYCCYGKSTCDVRQSDPH